MFCISVSPSLTYILVYMYTSTHTHTHTYTHTAGLSLAVGHIRWPALESGGLLVSSPGFCPGHDSRCCVHACVVVVGAVCILVLFACCYMNTAHVYEHALCMLYALCMRQFIYELYTDTSTYTRRHARARTHTHTHTHTHHTTPHQTHHTHQA